MEKGKLHTLHPGWLWRCQEGVEPRLDKCESLKEFECGHASSSSNPFGRAWGPCEKLGQRPKLALLSSALCGFVDALQPSESIDIPREAKLSLEGGEILRVL